MPRRTHLERLSKRQRQRAGRRLQSLRDIALAKKQPLNGG